MFPKAVENPRAQMQAALLSILKVEKVGGSAEKPLEQDFAAAIEQAFKQHVPGFDYDKMVMTRAVTTKHSSSSALRIFDPEFLAPALLWPRSCCVNHLSDVTFKPGARQELTWLLSSAASIDR
jgi:hypothetical protein